MNKGTIEKMPTGNCDSCGQPISQKGMGGGYYFFSGQAHADCPDPRSMYKMIQERDKEIERLKSRPLSNFTIDEINKYLTDEANG